MALSTRDLIFADASWPADDTLGSGSMCPYKYAEFRVTNLEGARITEAVYRGLIVERIYRAFDIAIQLQITKDRDGYIQTVYFAVPGTTDCNGTWALDVAELIQTDHFHMGLNLQIGFRDECDGKGRSCHCRG